MAMGLLPTQNYYDILEVSPSAAPEEIREAHRRLAMIWHPDLNPAQTFCEDTKFKLINEAYGLLGNEITRASYDQLLKYDNCFNADNDNHGTNPGILGSIRTWLVSGHRKN